MPAFAGLQLPQPLQPHLPHAHKPTAPNPTLQTTRISVPACPALHPVCPICLHPALGQLLMLPPCCHKAPPPCTRPPLDTHTRGAPWSSCSPAFHTLFPRSGPWAALDTALLLHCPAFCILPCMCPVAHKVPLAAPCLGCHIPEPASVPTSPRLLMLPLAQAQVGSLWQRPPLRRLPLACCACD